MTDDTVQDPGEVVHIHAPTKTFDRHSCVLSLFHQA